MGLGNRIFLGLEYGEGLAYSVNASEDIREAYAVRASLWS